MRVRIVLFLCFALLTSFQALSYGDVSMLTGRNHASIGQFGKMNVLAGQKYRDWNIEGGLGLVYSRTMQNNLEAMRFKLSRQVEVKDINFNTSLFYQWMPYSENFYVNQFGMLLQHQHKKWDYTLGVNSMFIQLRKQNQTANSFRKTLWEPFNVLYSLTYKQAIHKKVDVKATITNFDYFLIYQETNPFILLGGSYNINPKQIVFLVVAYQEAGLLNIRVQSFGYYIRLGFKYGITNK